MNLKLNASESNFLLLWVAFEFHGRVFVRTKQISFTASVMTCVSRSLIVFSEKKFSNLLWLGSRILDRHLLFETFLRLL
jgi:hypothetical protein